MIERGRAVRPAISRARALRRSATARPRRGLAAARLLAAAAILAIAGGGATPARGAAPPHPGPPSQVGKVEAGFQRGVCYAHIHRRDLGYGSDVSSATLARLRQLGVGWVSLTTFGYQRDVRSSKVTFRGDPSTRDSAIVRELLSIHGLGMRAILKPHIWAGDFYDGRWSGEIRMANDREWDEWFRTYESFILHYAGVAVRGRADAFCVGNELGATTAAKPARWRALIAKVRAVYPGPITYAANWHDEYERIPFWNALDWIGLNAYFDLTPTATPTAEEVKRTWTPIASRLGALSNRWKRPIVITEVGFRSVDRPAAHTHAWPEFDTTPHPNNEAQRACYEGTFRSLWGKPWLHGLYWWKYYSSPGGEGPEEADFTPAGKPAEAVLSTYYRSGDSAEPPLDKAAPASDHPTGGLSTRRSSQSRIGAR